MRKSLRKKTAAMVTIIALILTTAAVTVSYFVYKNAMEREYYSMTEKLARTEAAVMDKEKLQRVTDAVMDIYREQVSRAGGIEALSTLMEQESDTYFSAYSAVEQSEDYKQLHAQLDAIQQANGVKSIYIAYMDVETNAGIYILDASLEPCRTGAFDSPMTEEGFERISNGIYELPPYITNYDEYGWLCTASVGVYDDDGKIIANAYVDISMNEVVQNRVNFLRHLANIMLLITVILSTGFAVSIDKRIVDPIKRLSHITGSFISGGYVDDTEEIKIASQDEIGQLYSSVSKMRQDIRDYMTDLTRITAEKERISAELNVATQIQADMLPSIFPPFPERSEFEIYAAMTPAKEVGGDFYDFFLIDDDHLAIVMADVSGKGVPAALFMVIAKTLIKNRAQRGGTPAEILAEVNNQLCEGNEAGLFVTVWLAILEISTGRGLSTNAGHEHPALRRADGKFVFIRTRHSLALAAMENVRFRENEFKLNPGDTLFVYTDGVTEATDSDNQLFGSERMLDVLNVNPDADVETLIHNVREGIEGFVGDAPQFDDITMLSLKYFGKDEAKMKTIVLEATDDNLSQAIAFVEEMLEEHDCPMKAMMQIDLALEEAFVNVAHYAYAPGTGNVEIGLDITGDNTVTLTLADSGKPYDPLEKDDPDVTLSAEQRDIGGLGIFLVKKNMDDVAYEYKDGKNVLTMVKKF